ncbi:DUF4931 domain-containing protein [Sporomusa malonica]|uniref:DUF4931 domain-containing protein n=1 Tax=Sporomusa malonica TaxID=112901 RepID=UPI001FE2B6E8|nr:DUF4931 domain-containing protein [Sporomusa malonica]
MNSTSSSPTSSKSTAWLTTCRSAPTTSSTTLTATCNSYNIFFYHISGQITAKVMPRFVTSPIYVGYAIPQLSTRIPDVAADLKRIYGL